MIWVAFVVYILIDNFRRHDHSGWAKAGWLLFIMFVPLIGAIAYMIARPATARRGRYWSLESWNLERPSET